MGQPTTLSHTREQLSAEEFDKIVSGLREGVIDGPGLARILDSWRDQIIGREGDASTTTALAADATAVAASGEEDIAETLDEQPISSLSDQQWKTLEDDLVHSQDPEYYAQSYDYPTQRLKKLIDIKNPDEELLHDYRARVMTWYVRDYTDWDDIQIEHLTGPLYSFEHDGITLSFNIQKDSYHSYLSLRKNHTQDSVVIDVNYKGSNRLGVVLETLYRLTSIIAKYDPEKNKYPPRDPQQAFYGKENFAFVKELYFDADRGGLVRTFVRDKVPFEVEGVKVSDEMIEYLNQVYYHQYYHS